MPVPNWFPVPEDVSGTDDHFVVAGKFPHGYHEPLCVLRVDSLFLDGTLSGKLFANVLFKLILKGKRNRSGTKL